MTKPELKALEKAFEREVNGHYPFQPRGVRMIAMCKQLCECGYMELVRMAFGHGPTAVVVMGYALTHRGRITYCESCKDVEIPE